MRKHTAPLVVRLCSDYRALKSFCFTRLSIFLLNATCMWPMALWVTSTKCQTEYTVVEGNMDWNTSQWIWQCLRFSVKPTDQTHLQPNHFKNEYSQFYLVWPLMGQQYQHIYRQICCCWVQQWIVMWTASLTETSFKCTFPFRSNKFLHRINSICSWWMLCTLD